MDTEKVLVVSADLLPLPPTSYVTGAGQIQSILDICSKNCRFMPRKQAEVNPAYKQLIPYVTVICRREILYLERTSAQSEARLHGKGSLGVGGHINPTDQGRDLGATIANALTRELQEELWLSDPGNPWLAGLINDDSTSVGSVHLGLHYILHVEHKPEIRETDKMTARWLSYPRLKSLSQRMETWSRILLPSLASAARL
ncbi:MAG TPA: NUDIX domain-containing protein [Bacillota bacterium]|nr:NUDIX domain-containing protein [Bacillota bacterium]HQE02627.1 NUDIX domain-containing protein [Bacillota bacterium]